ncbi:MAG: DoxX family protein [Stackebrandtia sp.]
MIARIQPFSLLLIRLVAGAVFIMHGWQKLSTQGLPATAEGMEQMGVPSPTLAAYYATFVELIGGAALVLGALLPLAGVLLTADMVGALIFVHAPEGFFLPAGYEFVVVLAAVSLGIGFSGGGALAVDSLIPGLRAKTTTGDTTAT